MIVAYVKGYGRNYLEKKVSTDLVEKIVASIPDELGISQLAIEIFDNGLFKSRFVYELNGNEFVPKLFKH